MKAYLYFLTLFFLVLFSGCSKDDGIKISSISLDFVYVNGAAISSDSCINPNSNYGVEVHVITEGSGQMEPTQINFTLNGVLHSITFNAPGTKVIPIVLTNGPNIAQLLDNGDTRSINLILQGEFELVN